MSGLALYLSQDLDALVERYVAQRGATDDPLARQTVVVPNAAVGQWFEQAVARRTGRDGGPDGVVANVDIIFPAGFIGRVLYGSSHGLDRWSSTVLALALLDDDQPGRLSMTEALSRAATLERVITHRADHLEEILASPGLERERRLLTIRAAADELNPTARFARDGLSRPDLAGSHVAVVGCLSVTVGGLLCDVARAVSSTVPVDVFLALAARSLGDAPAGAPEDRSLVERWGSTQGAHLAQWRTRAAPHVESWVESVATTPAREALGASLRGEAPVAPTGPFLEVHRAVGVARQVEVARDALLRALDEFGIRPHEVRVVTPSASKVAPLLSLFFQPDDASDPNAPRLQFEVADPHVARPSPRVDAFRALLRVADGDLTVHDVALVLGQPSVRTGLGLSRRDAARLIDLAREGRVSLGLDAAARASLNLFDEDDDAGTWSRFVDRVVLSSVFDVERDARAPDIATLGVADDLWSVTRFEALIAWMRDAALDCQGVRDLAAWTEVFGRWATLIGHDERTRDPGLDRLLAQLGALALDSRAAMGFDDARDLVEALAERIGGATLMGRGGVALVDLVGAATLPFEVTCVVGLDDDALPESGRRIAAMGEPRPTDPDARAEFRSALLGLLASTRRRVLFITNDRSVIDGSDLSTTLPLAELLEVAQPAGLVRQRRHPRHGFSAGVPRGEGEDDESGFSFDPVHAAVAATLAARDASRPESDVSLRTLAVTERVTTSTVDIRRVAEYLRRPQRVFLRDALGAAALDPGVDREIPDVPLLDLGGPLASWSLRESLLRNAVETGDPPEVPRGPDSLVAGVAAGFRAAVLAELDVDELAGYAAHVRDSLASLEAVRDPRGLRAAVVQGQHHEVSRPPVELYASVAGALLVRHSAATGFSSRVTTLICDLAVVTIECGAPVTGVLLRARRRAERERDASAWPFLTATWDVEDPAAAARRLLGGLLRIYDKRLAGLPLLFHDTSLAYGARQLELGLADVVVAPRDEWFRRGFGENPDRGESLEPENQLLVPLDYDELEAAFDGAFATDAIELARVLSAVSVQVHSGATPWTRVVASMGATS